MRIALLLVVGLALSGLARADSSVPPAAHPGQAAAPDLDEIARRLVFRPGRLELAPEASEAIDALIAWLHAHPNSGLSIQAHTDGLGSAEWNLQLSQQRAETIRRALVARGVAPSRLRPIGYGETRPIASNATAAGRALNRRIELHSAPLKPGAHE